MTTTDDMVSAGQLAAEDNLADALERNRALKAALAKLHQPRRMAGGVVRCITCAEWDGRGAHLKRAVWPCVTAKAAGLDET